MRVGNGYVFHSPCRQKNLGIRGKGTTISVACCGEGKGKFPCPPSLPRSPIWKTSSAPFPFPFSLPLSWYREREEGFGWGSFSYASEGLSAQGSWFYFPTTGIGDFPFPFPHFPQPLWSREEGKDDDGAGEEVFQMWLRDEDRETCFPFPMAVL